MTNVKCKEREKRAATLRKALKDGKKGLMVGGTREYIGKEITNIQELQALDCVRPWQLGPVRVSDDLYFAKMFSSPRSLHQRSSGRIEDVVYLRRFRSIIDGACNMVRELIWLLCTIQ